MNFILTTSCNKGCPYCFAHENKENNPNSTMSLEQFENLIDKTNTRIKLLGGEPTQHPLFKEFVELLIKKNRPFTLISNFLFNNDILELLIDAGKKINIQYLVNATDLDKFNRIKLWSKNYTALYKAAYPNDQEENISVGLTIYNNDKKYYINYLNFLINNVPALERLRISINFPGNKEDKEDFYFINNKELGKIVLALVSGAVHNGIAPSIDCILFPCMFENKEEYKYIKKFVNRLSLKCGVDGVPADIFPDNTVSYCYPLKDTIAVDSTKYDSLDIVANDLIIRYKIIESIITPPAPCLECRFYKGLCNGPCLGFYNLDNINLGRN